MKNCNTTFAITYFCEMMCTQLHRSRIQSEQTQIFPNYLATSQSKISLFLLRLNVISRHHFLTSFLLFSSSTTATAILPKFFTTEVLSFYLGLSLPGILPSSSCSGFAFAEQLPTAGALNKIPFWYNRAKGSITARKWNRKICFQVSITNSMGMDIGSQFRM